MPALVQFRKNAFSSLYPSQEEAEISNSLSIVANKTFESNHTHPGRNATVLVKITINDEIQHSENVTNQQILGIQKNSTTLQKEKLENVQTKLKQDLIQSRQKPPNAHTTHNRPLKKPISYPLISIGNSCEMTKPIEIHVDNNAQPAPEISTTTNCPTYWKFVVKSNQNPVTTFQLNTTVLPKQGNVNIWPFKKSSKGHVNFCGQFQPAKFVNSIETMTFRLLQVFISTLNGNV